MRGGDFVAVYGLALIVADGRALRQQAEKREHLDKLQLRLADARRHEHIHIQRAQFHILYTAAPQRRKRHFLLAGGALRAHRAVILVLNLQNAGVDLAVLAADLDAKAPVRRVLRRHRAPEACHITGQAVVVGADADAGLLVVLIADVAHAQRSRVAPVQRRLIKRLQPRVRRRAKKRPADGRRHAEQIRNHPRQPQKVAYQPHVALRTEGRRRPRRARQFRQRAPAAAADGVVEMNAGDHLHRAPVAVAEAAAVNRLHAPEIGRAVARQRNFGLVLDNARHARRPQQFIADARVHLRVAFLQKSHGVAGAGQRRRHKLQHRLGEVRCDKRMRQRRAERARVRRLRQHPARADAQRLFLKADAPPVVHQARAAAGEGRGGALNAVARGHLRGAPGRA